MQHSRQPQRRVNDLSLQHVALETLVYDELAHKAFCLNEVAATVWNLLDGTRTPAELSAAATAKLGYAVSEDLVVAALAQFEADGLLETVAVAPVYAEAGMLSRRRLMVAMAAGAVVLLPVVHPMMTASAAQTYNGCVDCVAQPSSSAQKTVPAKSNSTSTPLFNDDVK